ncbi:uncharacterized protein [Haliotis cracherodii]|uniref:uncharacterized protein n=1 Tax=Haliotis cracherodii TaxID=6455 RepID=UPI0039EC92BD
MVLEVDGSVWFFAYKRNDVSMPRKNIERCHAAVKLFQDTMATSPNIQFMGIHVHYLYGIDKKLTDQDKLEKREKRNLKLVELTKHISALRNSNGGYLLVHIVGLIPNENYLGAFDEFADDTLYKMIEDGRMFESVYKKARLSEAEGCNQFHDFISIFVTKGTEFSTADFKTKISLDWGIITPLPITMKRFVVEQNNCNHIHREEIDFKFNGDFETISQLQEKRDLQLKGFMENKLKVDWKLLSGYEKARTVWDDFRLREYVSAFTKNKRGGSFLLGIGEKEKGNDVYKSKDLIVQGVPLEDENEFRGYLEELVHDESLVCDFKGHTDVNWDIMEVKCTLVPPRYVQSSTTRGPHTTQYYIVEVLVRPINGVAFYDKKGPVSCRIINNICTPVDVKTWFEKIAMPTQSSL